MVLLQSSGTFFVTVTGSGSITLSDIELCVSELSPFILDPARWIIGEYDFTKFLRNDLQLFSNLSGCAALYLSSPDYKLALYGSGWVCPLSTGAVFGAASPQVSTPVSTLILALAASFVVQLALTRRRQR